MGKSRVEWNCAKKCEKVHASFFFEPRLSGLGQKRKGGGLTDFRDLAYFDFRDLAYFDIRDLAYSDFRDLAYSDIRDLAYSDMRPLVGARASDDWKLSFTANGSVAN